MTFADRPVLVFWEMTRACPLACAHCRASAMLQPLPGELTTQEGRELLEEIARFGTPTPTVILTGGDPLGRTDLFPLIEHARGLGLNVAVSPAVSDRLAVPTLQALHDAGVASVSISLDGGTAPVHEQVRGVPGHFSRTLEALDSARAAGLRVQVNSTVMARNVAQLPQLFHLLQSRGIRTWEVFSLIRTGRGSDLEDLSPEAMEDVAHFLFDASQYGVVIRPVEMPFLRRVLRERSASMPPPPTALYQGLRRELIARMGPFTHPASLSPRGTLDGDGIVFVGYDGAVQPGGFLPLQLGDVRTDSLVALYRSDRLLNRIRSRDLRGPCGICPERWVCGGSRARAFVGSGDPLASDPACLHAQSMLGTA